MSDCLDFTSEYLSFGFCRENEKALRIYIPDYIIKLVHRYNVKFIILAYGHNTCGQFGIGDQQTKGKWRLKRLESLLPSLSNIFINDSSVFVINAMQSIYAAGNNHYSRLGMKEEEVTRRVDIFTEVCNKQQPVLCSNGICNINHTFVYLVDDNKLYANGLNQYGQFGNGRKKNHQQSQAWLEIEPFWNSDTRISKIACTYNASLFLMNNGDLYGCGGAYGSKPKRIKTNVEDMAAGFMLHVILGQNGELEVNGLWVGYDLKAVNKYFEYNKIRAKQISAGRDHCAFLTVNNEGFTFGDNDYGQCGNVNIGGSVSKPKCIQLPNKEYPTKVRCGGDHSLLLTNKNNVYGFGDNACHQISALIQEDFIATPYLLDKEKELNLNESQFICDVLPMPNETLIFIDPSKRVFINK